MSVRALPLHIVRDDRDGELVEALRHHEASAAERLVATYQDRAYRLAIGITANAQDAEEVVQDAFVKLVRGVGHVEAVLNLSVVGVVVVVDDVVVGSGVVEDGLEVHGGG